MIATTRGLVVAAPRSGSGKTTVTLGLLRALRRRGLRVGSAKCGPDYIDPAFHMVATGRTSLNLDSWAMTPDRVRVLAHQAGEACELVIAEGLMGLFDGVPAASGRTGSTADIAAAIGWPILLVHDCGGQAQSAAAQIAGCLGFDPRLRFAGVILNRVGSERHSRLIAGALEPLGVATLGRLPKMPDLTLPERHLGLVQASETETLDARLEAMADLIEQHVDLDAVVAAAASGPPDPVPASGIGLVPPPGQRIAVARDEAFSFLYPHVAEGWRASGASLHFFSPIADEAPDESCDSCWLPGGYPELHAGRIAASAHFLDGLRRFAATRPVHGECGGYMVLGRRLVDAGGRSHAMAGLLSVETSFAKRKLHLGYREAELLESGPIAAAGARLTGHEFHYATVLDAGEDKPFALVRDAYGGPAAPGGSRRGPVSGSFFHVLAAA